MVAPNFNKKRISIEKPSTDSPYVYLLYIFHHLYLQRPQKQLPKGNIMYALIQ
jgi:hypothetical protein